MIDIKEIDTFRLSNYINVFRQFMLENGFFEHALYSTRPFKIEGANAFELSNNLFLRYGTEPEIWKIGDRFDKFFWIGSLFRLEEKLTRIHNYEFKLLDFYIKNGLIKDIIEIFFKLLSETEKSLNLNRLSKLELVYISYKDFQSFNYKKDSNYWLIIVNYPKNESFYDTSFNEDTNKFEIMFVNKTEIIEIASAGIVGKNLNKLMYIENDSKLVNSKIFNEKFIGLGFGIERLIYLYSTL